MKDTLNQDTIKPIFSDLDIDIEDPDTRAYMNSTLMGWSILHLSHYFDLGFDDFHGVMVNALEDPDIDLLGLLGFRGSAKSTFGSLALPTWGALENKYPFILPVADTGIQMKTNIQNIKYELENNEDILRDYGMAYNANENWSNSSLLLNNDTLILGRSRGSKIRGLRHRQHRPSLISIDDPEDLVWVKTQPNRDKTETWFNAEVVPAVQEYGSKVVVIGNLLHNDCLLARLRKRGTFHFVNIPFFKADGSPQWGSKYPTPAHVERQKRRVGSHTAWAREYELKVISEDEQVITEDDIKKYPLCYLKHKDTNGEDLSIRVIKSVTAVDLAISEKKTADATAGVTGHLVEIDYGGSLKRRHVLILPDIVHGRYSFHTAIAKLKGVYQSQPMGHRMAVEDFAYQRAAIQEMKKQGMNVSGIRPISDKRARLESISPHIIDGTVLFPDEDNPKLLALYTELFGFGVEPHDDLVDALVYVIMELMHSTTNSVVTESIDRL